MPVVEPLEAPSNAADAPVSRAASRFRAGWFLRGTIFVHRYLGIGLGILMALWCLSGIVMMYVPYPYLDEADRVAALPAIDWKQCCVTESLERDAGARVGRFQIEMLGDLPVLRAEILPGDFRLIDLTTGRAFPRIDKELAWRAAARFAASEYVSMREAQYELIDHDQWTVGGFRADRPLHHIRFNDATGTEVYVSSRTGKVVQVTTASQRFWNWLGAVPHWLYFSALRQYPQAWTQVVIWTSLLGSFLTVAGLYIGISQLRRRRSGALSSPYRGIMYWHHVPGLIFGLFALTWVVSGLLSMNPWGLMESDGIFEDQQALTGEAPTVSQVRALLGTVPPNSPSGVVSIRGAPLDGAVFAISSAADGSRRRFSSEGHDSPLTSADFDKAARRLTGDEGPAPSWTTITQDDAYHYSVGRQHAQLPAVRVSANASPGVFYYLDPVSGELIDKADAGGRAYRWWHSGLHRLDFSAALRSSVARNFLMLPLLLGAAFVCVVGAYLGIRRLVRS